MKNPMTKLKSRLALDYACWIGATGALVWFGHPTIAALVGATGIMYLRWATKKYFSLKAHYLMLQAAMNEFIQFLHAGEQSADSPFTIKKFDNEKEFADWLAKGEDDDQPNP